MTEVPAETPVTTPDDDPIVAIPGEPLLQVPPPVASASVTADPTHNDAAPNIAEGGEYK